MKKLLIGIVTLLATVALTSPSFGALYEFASPDGGGGKFIFEAPVLDDLDLSIYNSGDQTVINEMSAWGVTETFQEFDDYNFFYGDNADLKSGMVAFSLPVEVVLAKWGGYQWAFKLDGSTNTVAWENLNYGMSHARGYNPVPIPAAVWLLGSGMLSLVAVRRRQS